MIIIQMINDIMKIFKNLAHAPGVIITFLPRYIPFVVFTSMIGNFVFVVAVVIVDADRC